MVHTILLGGSIDWKTGMYTNRTMDIQHFNSEEHLCCNLITARGAAGRMAPSRWANLGNEAQPYPWICVALYLNMSQTPLRIHMYPNHTPITLKLGYTITPVLSSRSVTPTLIWQLSHCHNSKLSTAAKAANQQTEKAIEEDLFWPF